jgi:hypothetical protein
MAIGCLKRSQEVQRYTGLVISKEAKSERNLCLDDGVMQGTRMTGWLKQKAENAVEPAELGFSISLALNL